MSLKGVLRDMDTEVSRRRDALPVSKQSRDALRNGNTTLKQRNGLLGNNSLLRDFEEKVVSRAPKSTPLSYSCKRKAFHLNVNAFLFFHARLFEIIGRQKRVKRQNGRLAVDPR